MSKCFLKADQVLIVLFWCVEFRRRHRGKREQGRKNLALSQSDSASSPSTSNPPALLAALSSFSAAISAASRFALPLGALRDGRAATANLPPDLGASR